MYNQQYKLGNVILTLVNKKATRPQKILHLMNPGNYQNYFQPRKEQSLFGRAWVCHRNHNQKASCTLSMILANIQAVTITLEKTDNRQVTT
jgi:hypothetical protein